MYETILVPTHRRVDETEAERQAVDIASRYDSEVVGLFVAETRATPIAPGLSPSDIEDMFFEEREHPAVTLEQTAEHHDVATTTATRVGHAYTEIVEAAAEWDADLVVMATHGRSGLDRYLLGSTTERTLRETDVPVLCVPRVN